MGALPFDPRNLCPDIKTSAPWFGLFYEFADDDDVSTKHWTYNVTNSTAPTTVDDARGGCATFTNAGADNDRIEASHVAEIFKLDVVGSQLLFVARAKFTNLGTADYGFGIHKTDTDWLGDTAFYSDGLGFQVDNGKSYVDGISAYNATSLTDYARQAGMKTLDTDFHTFAMLIDMDSRLQGAGVVRYYVDGNVVGVYRATDQTICFDEELCLYHGVQNGAAAAKSWTLDYIGAFQTR